MFKKQFDEIQTIIAVMITLYFIYATIDSAAQN